MTEEPTDQELSDLPPPPSDETFGHSGSTGWDRSTIGGWIWKALLIGILATLGHQMFSTDTGNEQPQTTQVTSDPLANGVGHAEFGSPPINPASVNAALTKACGKTIVTIGGTNTAKFFSQTGQPSKSDLSVFRHASAMILCAMKDETVIAVAFFRNAQDENFVLNTGNDSSPEKAYDWVGWGFDATVVPKDKSLPTGDILTFMNETFQTRPIILSSRNIPVQQWTETLPPITMESFGLPRPTVYKP